MALHIYRVTVRGFFDGLEPATRERLLADADHHDAMDAAFTEAGTFTYDRTLTAFSFRYQLRVSQPDDEVDRAAARAAAERAGSDRATSTLTRAGVGCKRLRVTVADMADVWADDADEPSPSGGAPAG